MWPVVGAQQSEGCEDGDGIGCEDRSYNEKNYFLLMMLSLI